ncbi:bifunctional 3,4-dihydroxy-2-butanone-4-phosphate synthase/GTP cyclohydrolase II [Dehalococcoides mccartyi]|uniref:3,4-dihydroxy-2-butanone-4-phosphate synthase n=1 Tax=Dehalococcoides mccartyi TaxID=61435 RepID=A0A2J1DW13_9CHLR|nr:bifunctional 3,4-dihydroxy-2-butanone-4-phosphate synthase/GTP cyclohydrolase II [Dehalococcoides mccartyi]
MPNARVEEAIADIKAGRFVIVVDDYDRENEGDLVMASEKVTPDAINFMAKNARGLICVSLIAERLEQLKIPMMVTENTSPYSTGFTVTVEARKKVTTGISAADRAATVQVLIDRPLPVKISLCPAICFPCVPEKAGFW